MIDRPTDFGSIAQKLARNPLGIIALFIVLVYSFAALVTGFSGSFTLSERLPLIYFLVIFPVLVLAVFAWLVSQHSNKLFAPSDFRNEENYVRTLTATASLAIASTKSSSETSPETIRSVVESVQEISGPTRQGFGHTHWRDHVLWVDDRPDNNINERAAFEAMGVSFTLALSTEAAITRLTEGKYAAIISDMGRIEGPREGYVLLDRIRSSGNPTPFFVYGSSNALEHKLETSEHGGQGCTNNPQELFRMVMRAMINH